MPHHICQTSNAPIFEKKPLKSSIHQWKICVPLSSFLEPVIANMSHILKHSCIISNSYQVPTLNFKHTTIENLLVLSSNHIRYYLQLCDSFPFFAKFFCPMPESRRCNLIPSPVSESDQSWLCI